MLSLRFCVCVFCFLTLTKSVCALGGHRVKLYVMCCALVCDMFNVRVCLVCDFVVWVFVFVCVMLCACVLFSVD